MEPKETRAQRGPESPIKAAIKAYMELRGWYVIVTHGNMYQSGLPDLYCIHQSYRDRWVEVKYKGKYEFTPAQLKTFPEFAQRGIGIWVLAMHDHKNADELLMEYRKLWEPPNFYQYIGHTKRS